MKPLLLLLLSLSAGTLLAANPAAREAIRTVGRERGAANLTRVIQVFGDLGMHQPKVWRVVTSNGRSLQEYYVQGRSIVAEGPVPPASAAQMQSPAISLTDLEVDSTGAFSKAEAAARAAKVGFDNASYQLRALELSTAPAWFLTLKNAAGQKVGEVTVGAKTGRVLRTAWFSPTAAAPATAPVNGFHRTRAVASDAANKVGTTVRNGASRAGQWIKGKFVPARTQSQPYYIPYRAR